MWLATSFSLDAVVTKDTGWYGGPLKGEHLFDLITQLSSVRGGAKRAFRPIVLLVAVVFSVNAFGQRDDPKTADAYGVSIDVSIFPPLNLMF